MKFNINDYVKVKLTDYGKLCLKKNYDDMMEFLKSWYGDDMEKYSWLEFKLPEEDGEGYSEWQLWKLMQEFGKYCENGFTIPFETEIIIEEKE